MCKVKDVCMKYKMPGRSEQYLGKHRLFWHNFDTESITNSNEHDSCTIYTMSSCYTLKEQSGSTGCSIRIYRSFCEIFF